LVKCIKFKFREMNQKIFPEQKNIFPTNLTKRSISKQHSTTFFSYGVEKSKWNVLYIRRAHKGTRVWERNEIIFITSSTTDVKFFKSLARLYFEVTNTQTSPENRLPAHVKEEKTPGPCVRCRELGKIHTHMASTSRAKKKTKKVQLRQKIWNFTFYARNRARLLYLNFSSSLLLWVKNI
jgi:hypothetical protein